MAVSRSTAARVTLGAICLSSSSHLPLMFRAHPSQTENQRKPAWDRRVVLSAIGQCLKDQYDALASPVPPQLAALVRQLETQK